MFSRLTCFVLQSIAILISMGLFFQGVFPIMTAADASDKKKAEAVAEWPVISKWKGFLRYSKLENKENPTTLKDAKEFEAFMKDYAASNMGAGIASPIGERELPSVPLTAENIDFDKNMVLVFYAEGRECALAVSPIQSGKKNLEVSLTTVPDAWDLRGGMNLKPLNETRAVFCLVEKTELAVKTNKLRLDPVEGAEACHGFFPAKMGGKDLAFLSALVSAKEWNDYWVTADGKKPANYPPLKFKETDFDGKRLLSVTLRVREENMGKESYFLKYADMGDKGWNLVYAANASPFQKTAAQTFLYSVGKENKMRSVELEITDEPLPSQK